MTAWIATFKNNSDEYVRIHKAKEKILFDRNVVALELNNEMDDVKSFLEQDAIDRISKLMFDYWTALSNKEVYLQRWIDKANKLGSRKEVVMDLIPKLKSKMDAQFIFKVLDGADLRELLLEKTKVACGNNTKFDDFMKWLKDW